MRAHTDKWTKTIRWVIKAKQSLLAWNTAYIVQQHCVDRRWTDHLSHLHDSATETQLLEILTLQLWMLGQFTPHTLKRVHPHEDGPNIEISITNMNPFGSKDQVSACVYFFDEI